MRMRTIKTDVAIMGSGLAGLSAALVAQEHGMKVAVFEKRPFQGGGVSNTPMQTMAIRDDPAYQDKAFKIHMDYTRWNANPHVVRAWLQNSTRIPGFIRSLGIDFLNIKYNPLEELGTTRGYEVGFPNAVHIGDYYRFKAIGKGHGGAVICKKASDKIKAQGGEVYFSMPIQSLIKENGKVVGAWALDRKTGEQVRIEAGAVVVASGGFNDNKEYIEKYCDLTLTDKNCSGDGNVVFNNFTGSQLTGDGQTAVWEIGGDKGAMGVSGHNITVLGSYITSFVLCRSRPICGSTSVVSASSARRCPMSTRLWLLPSRISPGSALILSLMKILASIWRKMVWREPTSFSKPTR